LIFVGKLPRPDASLIFTSIVFEMDRMGVSFHKDGFWTRNGSGVVGSGNFCVGLGLGALADPRLKIAVLDFELVELVLNFWIIKELFWANPLRKLLLD
jgi:hypothetical protein